MRWLVFTNVYVAFCGAALTAASYALIGEPPQVNAVVALVFCCTLVIYNLDRLVEPSPGDSAHEQWIERHRRVLWALTLASAIGAAGIAIVLAPAVLISLLCAGAIAVGYCVPVVPGRKRVRRLKEIPGAKLLLIAGVWTYATAGLPMLSSNAPINGQATAILAGRFLFLAAVALPFDLPDMQRDRQAGIATLPTLLGIQATRRVAIGLALSAIVVGVLHPWPASGAVALSALLAACLLLALRADRGVLYFMVALDGMLLVQAGLLWLFTYA